jgi:hypothetical protein
MTSRLSCAKFGGVVLERRTRRVAAAVNEEVNRQLAMRCRPRRPEDVHEQTVLIEDLGPLPPSGCAQAEPNLVASRTPLQLLAAAGGFQRSAPVGGAA